MMDLMSFLSDEEWETVTEPLMEGKANIYIEPPFTGEGRGKSQQIISYPRGRR